MPYLDQGWENKVLENVSAKIRDHLKSLEDEIRRKFQDYKTMEHKISLLLYLITADIDTELEELQLEPADLQ
ncbi:hypothetical protein TNCV_3730961 [Trichonephila clavipes]|nr:hypothetical protein TNCV_3730961 [Trichonephila clavipes]